MSKYGQAYRRGSGPRSRRVSGMGEWRNGNWALNYGRRGPGRGYDRGYEGCYPECGLRPRDYDWEFARRAVPPKGPGYDAFAHERDHGYSRENTNRFRRPPEGAELKEFRPEEMGPLWDR